jgi:hypothetical protein
VNKSVPSTLIQASVDKYVGSALRSDAPVDPPVDKLTEAAKELLKLTGACDLRLATQACAQEFTQRLETRLAGQANGGKAGECVRHARERLERAFGFLH